MAGGLAHSLRLFVADMAKLPLPDLSIDCVLTIHALEPNHGRELLLLRELLRVTRHHLILFEPSWENGSDQVRARMAHYGYVRDLPYFIQQAGGHLVSVSPLPKPLNPMNPTYCYVIKPQTELNPKMYADTNFACPLSGCLLHRHEGYWWSKQGGWAYPEIDGIPCLRSKHAVLMSHE